VTGVVELSSGSLGQGDEVHVVSLAAFWLARYSASH